MKKRTDKISAMDAHDEGCPDLLALEALANLVLIDESD